MKNAFFIAIIVAVLFLIIQSLKNIEYPKGLNSIQTEMVNSQQRRGSTPEIGAPSLSTQINDEKESAPENSLIEKSSDKNQSSSPEENEEGSLTPQGTLKYELDEDGLVTVDGDIVLGAIKDGASRGEIQVPEFQLWPNGRIPFFIQGDLKNPARIIRALAMFVDTPIQFVPYHEATGEEDVLVFETAKSGCKSYLGQIGGKQPVWISEECGVTEIA
ncbi:MAG: M12 family metallopeptidase, partial [Bdellovibrio sp.]